MEKDFCVKLDWKKEDLIKTRSMWYLEQTGFTFVGGLKEYNTKLGILPVFFTEDRIYTRIKGNKKPITRTDFINEIRLAIKKRDNDYPCYGDYEGNYVELFDGKDWQDSVITWLGINKESLEQHYDDICQMWDLEEIPLCQPVMHRIAK